LVWGARLGTPDAGLRAGWMELGFVERHGKMDGDNFVTD
jgi:hypothetical protein